MKVKLGVVWRQFTHTHHTIVAVLLSHVRFVELEEFHEIIKGVLEVLEGQAKRIEREKLKAIGQRNRVDSEVENRNRQKQMLESLIKEKQTELERCVLRALTALCLCRACTNDDVLLSLTATTFSTNRSQRSQTSNRR